MEQWEQLDNHWTIIELWLEAWLGDYKTRSG
jgi:hypothetical protein